MLPSIPNSIPNYTPTTISIPAITTVTTTIITIMTFFLLDQLYFPARSTNSIFRALRALGLLLADGALTVGWGKTFWGTGQVPSRKRA